MTIVSIVSVCALLLVPTGTLPLISALQAFVDERGDTLGYDVCSYRMSSFYLQCDSSTEESASPNSNSDSVGRPGDASGHDPSGKPASGTEESGVGASDG